MDHIKVLCLQFLLKSVVHRNSNMGYDEIVFKLLWYYTLN